MFNVPGQVDHISVAQSQLVVELRHEGMDCESVRSHFDGLPSVAKLCILISMATVAAVLRRRFFLLVLFFCRRGWRLSLATSQCHGQTVGYPSWALKTLKALTRRSPGGTSLVGLRGGWWQFFGWWSSHMGGGCRRGLDCPKTGLHCSTMCQV